MGTVALHHLWSTLTRPKTVITAAFIGLAVIAAAWLLANSAVAFALAEPDGEPPKLWEKGSEGAIVTLAFGIMPLILPFLPIIVLPESLDADLASGFLEQSFTRPIPRWSLALAKSAGVFAALAVPTLIFSTAGTLLIPAVVGTAAATGLIWAAVGTPFFLLALYIALGLLLAMVLSSGLTFGLLIFLWIVFNAVSQGAFLLGGQFLLIVPSNGPQMFQPVLADAATFTGVYLGLFSLFVPLQLEFVVWPTVTDWPALVSAWAVVFVALPWLFFLLLFYVIIRRRYQVV